MTFAAMAGSSKKSLEQNQSYKDVHHVLGSNDSKKTINIVFMYEDGSFLGQKETQFPQRSLKPLI